MSYFNSIFKYFSNSLITKLSTCGKDQPWGNVYNNSPRILWISLLLFLWLSQCSRMWPVHKISYITKLFTNTQHTPAALMHLSVSFSTSVLKCLNAHKNLIFWLQEFFHTFLRVIIDIYKSMIYLPHDLMRDGSHKLERMSSMSSSAWLPALKLRNEDLK